MFRAGGRECPWICVSMIEAEKQQKKRSRGNLEHRHRETRECGRSHMHKEQVLRRLSFAQLSTVRWRKSERDEESCAPVQPLGQAPRVVNLRRYSNCPASCALAEELNRNARLWITK